MNKQLLLRFTKLALVMALFVAVAASLAALAQKRGDASDQLPHGQWSVGCKPYMGAGYESLPVLVTSVTSELAKGVGITKVSIENTTSQPLAAVKLSWYLSTQENPEAVLQQGQTRFLRLPGGIKAGEAREVLFPLVSFAKVSGALARNGIVNGNYSIQVAVSEARFEDGSTKILMASGNGKPHTAGFIKAAYRVAPTAQTFCPDQACSAVRSTTDQLLGYTCGSSIGSTCTNASGGGSCTDSLCGRSGGGGTPPIKPILE